MALAMSVRCFAHLRDPRLRCGVAPPPLSSSSCEGGEVYTQERAELLEASVRGRKKPKPPRGPGSASRDAGGSGRTGMAQWKQGQLFPEGWVSAA